MKRKQPMYRDLLDDIATLKATNGAARIAVLGLPMLPSASRFAARGGDFSGDDRGF